MKTIQELNTFDCRYIDPKKERDEEGEYLFCGEPVVSCTSWCEAHTKVVYTPGYQQKMQQRNIIPFRRR